MSYSVFKALEHYGRNATRDFSCYLIHGEEKLKKIFWLQTTITSYAMPVERIDRNIGLPFYQMMLAVLVKHVSK